MEWYCQGKTEVLAKKNRSLCPIHHTHFSHGLTLDRTRSCAVRGTPPLLQDLTDIPVSLRQSLNVSCDVLPFLFLV